MTSSATTPSVVMLERAVTTGAAASATTAPTVSAGIVDDAVNGPDTPAGSTHVDAPNAVDGVERLPVELLHQSGHHEEQREDDRPEHHDDHEAHETEPQVAEGQQDHAAPPHHGCAAAHSRIRSTESS